MKIAKNKLEKWQFFTLPINVGYYYFNLRNVGY